MLVGVLKYIEQTKIKSEVLKDNAKETIEWGKSLGQGGGSCTEHFGGFNQSPMLFFSGFEFPIPTLDKNYSTEKISIDGVHIEGGGNYQMFIGPNKELIFSRSKDPKKVVGASYLPKEADHLIKGLIYQSAKGLGRTSGSQLINILEYHYSDDFKKDQAESKARIAKTLSK